MALPLHQSFDAGTSGVTLTTANTGGTGINAFDAVSVGTGSTAAFSNAHAAHGTQSAVFATGVAGNPSTASWTTSAGSVTTLYGRAYLYLTAYPGFDDNLIAFKGSGTFGGGIMLAASGQLRTQNQAFGETGGPTLPLSQWFRLEWQAVAGSAGAASLTVYYYAAPDSGTVTSTVADIYGAFGSGGVITETDFGWTSSHASQPSTYFDSLALTATGYPGPDVVATPTSGMVQAAGAVESLTIAVSLGMADTAAAGDLSSAGPPPVPVAAADQAGATEALTVTQGPYTPVPVTFPLGPATPAFIRSQMPRMHVQNVLTGQWLHRDVQGITSPSVTWNLDQPDTFTCTLAPPRPDMLDATGNPLFLPWRDAVYLEENDSIRWGGLITGGTQSGQQWQLSCTGFAGYPNGMPYDGPSYTEYNVDAGDVIRYIWNYLQSGVNSDLSLQVTPNKIGTLLGSHVTSLASATLARTVTAADVVSHSGPGKNVPLTTYTRLFLSGNAQGFTAGMDLSVGASEDARVIAVISNAQNVQTGEVHVGGRLSHPHTAGEQVLQLPTNCLLSRQSFSAQNSIYLGNPLGFSAGTVILLKGGKPYTILNVISDANGVPTGQVTLTTNLQERHEAGETVVQAPTPFQLLWWNTPDCGQEIASIQAEAIFDWHEQHTWTSPAKEGVRHQLGFAVPRMGTRRTDLRFAEGENIIQPVQVTQGGTGFADSIIVLGSGSGGAQVRTGASQPFGHIRRVAVYQNQTMTTVARAASVGKRVLAAAEAAIDGPTQVVVVNHPNAPFGHFAPGDDIPVTLATGWRNTVFWVRITSLQQDPTTNIATLTVARSDSFTYLAQSGLAGTV
jgi:hypothetical protein